MAHITQEEQQKIREAALARVSVGSLYAHYKNPERHYKVLHIGFIEATNEPCVIYESQYGEKSIFVRPLENFLETVDGVPRFRKL